MNSSGNASVPSSPATGREEAAYGDRRNGLVDRRRGDGPEHPVRIAAVGDFHCGEGDVGVYRELFAQADEHADVLVLTGDLTRRGLPAEMRVVIGELADVKIPIVSVLGNHDYEADEMAECLAVLRGRGVQVLMGDTYEFNHQVGFAGVKGFMGGFGRGALTAFGEPETKAFVGAALDEVQKLELGLRRLSTPVRIAVLHYAPIAGTLAGEPEVIFPFLGSDRLAEPLDRYGATVAFHGHAHSGVFRGSTPGGVPVFNVSLPVLRREGIAELYFVYEVAVGAGVPG
ncbi:MAG: metallophosphoesterase [Gemmatimonadota bacterium]|nr:metallophosphoesterase [Gemmatimonadota bacterium]